MGTGRPAPKKRAAMKFFDEIAARYATPEEGEQAIKDMTLREIARKLGDEIEGGAHASSAMDWKTDWLIGRDDRVREAERARTFYRFSTEINANLWRCRSEARGWVLVAGFNLDKLVWQASKPPAKLPGPYLARGAFSFRTLVERQRWRVREPDHARLTALAADLDECLEDRSTLVEPEAANSRAWHQALDQLMHQDLQAPTDEVTNDA